MATLGQQGMQQSGSAVIGYFATGDAAHRAINALINEGFLPTEIGAAFHVSAVGDAGTSSGNASSEQTRQPDLGGSLRDELGTTLPHVTTHSNQTGASGANSDTTSVQYAALGGGAGTPFDGASRPGPISGSSLANTGLPSELKSELPHEGDVQRNTASASSAPSQTPSYVDPSLSISQGAHTHGQQHESWTDKLKHIFGGGHSHTGHAHTSDTLRKEVTRDSRDFGTGEGDLQLNKIRSTRYSQPAFEKSFSSYGVQPEHARHLSNSIGQGGAIVTVHAATTRITEAERILETNGGQTRFSAGSAQQSVMSGSEVEVFGTVGRDYPGFFD